MKKFINEEIVLIEEQRKLQEGYAREDEERFQQLLSKLDIDDDTSNFELINLIFDYVYNSTCHSENSLNYLKEKIYGNR